MTNRQLSDHIGNIDDRIVELSAKVPNYARRRRAHMAKRVAGMAAALVIMVGGGFGLGATVFAQEVEVRVEVPVEQETVTLEDFGITLILPDSWKGKYAVERSVGDGYEEYVFYSPEFRANFTEQGDIGGCLFYVNYYEGVYATQSEVEDPDGPWNYAGHRYIATTRDGTYVLYYPSDMQVHPFNGDYELYSKMESEIGEIRFVLDNALGE